MNDKKPTNTPDSERTENEAASVKEQLVKELLSNEKLLDEIVKCNQSLRNVNKKKAVLYARYSTDLQTENSIEAQRDAIMRFAETNGYEVIREYIDRAKSGRTTKGRDNFNRMMLDSADGEFQTVLVHKFDRFGRNAMITEKSRLKLAENNVELVSVSEPIVEGSASIIQRYLLTAMAEYYSVNLASEVRKGMAVVAKRGQHTGGKPPLGYDVDEKTKKLVINPEEAESVRIIYDMFIRGCSYKSMADYLNKRGYRTKTGGHFVINSFYDIIKNKKYCGYYIYNRASEATYDSNGIPKRNSHKNKDESDMIIIPNGIPAIISEETYNKAQKRIAEHRRLPGAANAKHPYLLSGLVYCGECGKLMTGNSRKGGTGSEFASYRCQRSHNHLAVEKKCDNKEIKQAPLEEFVLYLLEKEIFSEDKLPNLLERINRYYHERTYKTETELKNLKNKIAGLKMKQSNIVKSISEGINPLTVKDILDDLTQSLDEAVAEKERIEASINVPKADIGKLKEAISKFSEYVRNRDIPVCKEFIRDYVEKVVVCKNVVEVTLKVTSNSFPVYMLTKSIARQFLRKSDKR